MIKFVVFLLLVTTITVTAVYFECEYDYFRLGNIVGTQYSCHGIPQSGMNDPVIRGISGVHQTGRDNSHVIGFYIYHDKTMTFIPRGANQFCKFSLSSLPSFQNFIISIFLVPNMRALAILNCSLTVLEPNDLMGYHNLQALSLRENYIERIPHGFYEHVPYLLETNMFHNRIREVGHNILSPLVRLTGASFLSNYCIDMRADIDTLTALQNVLNANCTN